MFFNFLERKCFGRNKLNKHISRVPVLEHSEQASHFHVILIKPAGLSDNDFQRRVRYCWTKLKGTGVANLQLRGNGKEAAWYLPIHRSPEDWV